MTAGTGGEMGDYVEPMSGYATDIFRLQADNAALRDLVRALTEADDAGIGSQRGRWYENICSYCGSEGDTATDIDHAPDCPITRGRAALAKGANDE